jgi:glycosyltransferase involved in cell wall biosynthesis
MHKPPELCVIIPVYNEVTTLHHIVERIQTLPVSVEIIVVDDASTDGTTAIVHQLTQRGVIQSIVHTHNQGKGAAIRSALTVATAPLLVIQDADLEYDPRDFLRMLQVMRTGATVVYGTRFHGKPPQGMLWSHYVGNRLLTWYFNVLYRTHLTDLETCYKMCHTAVLIRQGIDHDRFDVDPEMTAKFVRQGIAIHEVPVTYHGRPYRAGKKIRPHDAFSAFVTMWHYRHWMLAGEQ